MITNIKSECYFNKNFIQILINLINEKRIYSTYKLNIHIKYSIDYICNIIKIISTKSNSNRYLIPQELCTILNVRNNVALSMCIIKKYVREQIIQTNIDICKNNYLIIGDNSPIVIKELIVIL